MAFVGDETGFSTGSSAGIVKLWQIRAKDLQYVTGVDAGGLKRIRTLKIIPPRHLLFGTDGCNLRFVNTEEGHACRIPHHTGSRGLCEAIAVDEDSDIVLASMLDPASGKG